MISLGLKRSEYKKYLATLRSAHWLYVRVQMQDMSHAYIGDISSRLIDGQVNIDAEAEVTRSLEMDLFDPTSSLRISSEDPDDGAVFMDRMVRVIYCIAPPDKSVWYEVPIFCGPITKVNRDSDVLKVEAQGKETLALSTMWRIKSYKKGLTKTTVIRRILTSIAGERRLSIPTITTRLPRILSLGYGKSPWKVSRRLAGSLDHQLFYNGRGVAVMRPLPVKTVFVFNEDNILTDPQIGYDASEAKNCVMVVGAKPKGAKKRIRVRKVAPKTHPLSPWKLGRTNADGVNTPRYLPLVIEDDSIRTKKRAKAIAKKELRKILVESVEATFDCLPAPHLEEMDVFRCETRDFSSEMRLKKMTIPLTADGVSSIGVLKRTNPRRRKFRSRRR